MSHTTPTEPGSARPRVSVLIPAFDAEATLSACLRSVERQTFPDWECLVVDDGSVDDTPAVAERYAASDPRFRRVSRPHRGLVETLNAGLDACRGEFVARMDADDVMHRLRLSEQLSALEDDPSLDGVGCHVRLFPRSAVAEGAREYERWLNGIDSPDRLCAEAFVECPIAHPTLTIRRDVLADARYRDRDWPEDYDLVLRLLAAGRRLGVVPRRRHGWRHHEGKHSRSDPRYGLDRFTRCKAAFLAQGFLADDDRYILWGHGPTGRALRRELHDLGKTPAQIVEVHPRRIGNVIAGAEVVAVERLPSLPRRPIVVSVAGAGPRRLIRAELDAMGFVETRDYFCAA